MWSTGLLLCHMRLGDLCLWQVHKLGRVRAALNWMVWDLETMAKKSSILLEADPGDPEDFPVDRAALDRAHMGRRIRRLRNGLGLTREGFAERYSIPLSAIREYEIARTMPPPPRGTGLPDGY